jgi:hypothetical protein
LCSSTASKNESAGRSFEKYKRHVVKTSLGSCGFQILYVPCLM